MTYHFHSSYSGSISCKQPTQASPTVSERLSLATTNVGIAHMADENALRNLLGLTTAGNVEQEHVTFKPSHYEKNQPQQQGYSQAPMHLQHSSGRELGYQASTSVSQHMPQHPARHEHFHHPMSQTQQPEKIHLLPAPLMPSVIQNKNRLANRNNGLADSQHQITQSQQQQPYRDQSFPSSSLLAPSQQSRSGARSIPPPPVPPIESRPHQQQLEQPTSRRDAYSKDQAHALSPSIALEILDQTIQTSPSSRLPAARDGMNEAGSKLDRHAFRNHIVTLLQVLIAG